MKKTFTYLSLLLFLATGSSFVSSFQNKNDSSAIFFPYKKAGLSSEEAAVHLLNRFSYGATPGQTDEVIKQGLEKWFQQQLDAAFNDSSQKTRLADYESLTMSNSQIVETYPRGGQVLKKAINDGVIDKNAARKDGDKNYKKDLKKYMGENGYKDQSELFRELISQKILRAAYSQNQLQEVMTSFWFNHFNVSVGKGDVRPFVTSYERDVIRPNALGKFETLVLETAKSPAMLMYLDNFKSVADDNAPGKKGSRKKNQMQLPDSLMKNKKGKIKKTNQKGLNENYAREIMELHTLGVDGGYTQSDVTQAARVFTGWTIHPSIAYNKESKGSNKEQEDFMFAENRHDKKKKIVLGTEFPAGGGYDEGKKLIHLLAAHPSTAKFIAKKLAVRFVSDNPPQSLVDKMTKTFLEKEGDIKQVLITMVNAPEFWSKEVISKKTKSPFEVIISAVRNTNAQVNNPYLLFQWMNKMGEKVYYYQAPTGFPDRGQYWINTGSLLNRMNFGLAFASQRIPGIKLNLLALNNNREPESAEAALKTYVNLLLPQRNADETIKRLTPLITDPELQKKVDDAAQKTETAKAAREENEEMMIDNEDMIKEKKESKKNKNEGDKKRGKNNKNQMQYAAGNNTLLSQVVGIILGSPEFQSR